MQQQASQQQGSTRGTALSPALTAIPQTLDVRQPSLANVAPARPTLHPGNTTMGTPVLPRPPHFDLVGDGNGRLLSKRKLSELVKQVDADETLDPDVEDLLLEIADEFIDSVTAFACRLAKHRKSDVLEVKDVLVHLERNWNIRVPGFSGDEVRAARKHLPNQMHQARMSALASARVLHRNGL